MGSISSISLGGATFRVFGSVSGADAYLAASVIHADAWDALATAAKQRAVISATRILNRVPWAGSRSVPTQPLAFPRSGLTVDGVDIADTVVPDQICEATYEIAALLAGGTTSIETSATTATGVKRVRERVEGAIDTETEWFSPGGSAAGTGGGTRFPEPIQSLIAPFLGGPGGGGSEVYGADSCSTIEGASYGFGYGGLP